MNIISIRQHPEYADTAIRYFSSKWSSVPAQVYDDSIRHCIGAPGPLPQWYLLENGGEIIGCAGLITNDFNSRMDLWPWICGLFIEEEHRGNGYGSLLLARAQKDSAEAGFSHVYLLTDHVGYYEKYGFEYIGQTYHPWEEESRVYAFDLKQLER
jgi:N-acetylglutamate synthase and related acetyltransferases